MNRNKREELGKRFSANIKSIDCFQIAGQFNPMAGENDIIEIERVERNFGIIYLIHNGPDWTCLNSFGLQDIISIEDEVNLTECNIARIYLISQCLNW